MGLASAMSTALTGLNAAETQISVIGNNLANSNTVGFKASSALFATQFLQTQSVGSSPTTFSGGNNPRQTGLGVMVAEIAPNFSQGTISTANSPTDLAIQGDGFFIVQGQNGQQNYTRNGTFKTNSQNQIVTGTGNRVMGYGINSKFQVDTTQLQPLSIPLGTATVAKATTEAIMQGALTPIGAIADTASIIQTGILTDGSKSYPGSETKTFPATGPAAAVVADPVDPTGAGPLVGDYQYYVTFVNGGVESKPQPVAVDSAAPVPPLTNYTVSLSNFPTDSSGTWKQTYIYRSVNVAGNTKFYKVGELPTAANPAATFSDHYDDTTIITTNHVLNMSGPSDSGPTATLDPTAGNLTGTYKYYVTFASGNVESRPQLVAVSSPLTANNQILLSNFPTDISGTWDKTYVYRSVNDQAGDTNFYKIGELPSTTDPNPTVPFTDNNTDATIRAGGHVLNMNGPAVTSTTLLKDVVVYDGMTYQNAFAATGTLQFAGSKGGNTLTTQSLTVTNTSTLNDLASFLQGSLGIQRAPGSNLLYPIPVDSPTNLPPGVTITSDGHIKIVGNDGDANSIEIGLSALQLITNDTPPKTSAVGMPFTSIQSAVGQGAMADMVVYDSLGIPLSVRVTAVLEERNSSFTEYRWYADCGQNDPGTGQYGIDVGTGTIRFDGQGNFLSSSNTTVAIGRVNEPSVKPLQFNLDFTQVTGLASANASLTVSRQDGSAPGVLNSFNISDTGMINGVFSNGISQTLGQMRLARFSNPVGLEQVGQNMYSTGVNSGLPIMGNPGDQGTGTIVAGSLELSNTDIGAGLINLITSSTMYRSNTRVITTATQLFDDLLQLR
ncbi:MAG: flagellar hook-basal body complex protein [Planctomycetota bacterium]